MAALNQIKKRMTVVTNAAKITQAMLLVSTSKLKKAKNRFEKSQPYFSEIYSVASYLFANSSSDDLKISDINNTTENRTILIAFSSDTGLCGGFNHSIIKSVEEQISLHPNYALILIGEKLINHFSDDFYMDKIIYSSSFSMFNLDLEMGDNKLGANVFNKISQANFNSAKIIYTKFINAISVESKCISLFPVDKSLLSSFYYIEEKKDYTVSFEPSKPDVIKSFYPLLFNTIIAACGLESFLSENSSRRNAMDSAFNNSIELKDNLKLQYNRLRQASITREISEIVAGSET
jgi:F-type H+-transporting ATPase subunit gamma